MGKTDAGSRSRRRARQDGDGGGGVVFGGLAQHERRQHWKDGEDRGYNVSKGELLDWASRVLGLPMSRLELCASGAAYCQLFDAYTPGSSTSPRSTLPRSSSTSL